MYLKTQQRKQRCARIIRATNAFSPRHKRVLTSLVGRDSWIILTVDGDLWCEYYDIAKLPSELPISTVAAYKFWHDVGEFLAKQFPETANRFFPETHTEDKYTEPDVKSPNIRQLMEEFSDSKNETQKPKRRSIPI